MAASSKCETDYSVYKDSEHVKEIAENSGSIGSLGEFCGAFYHVSEGKSACLDKENCIIGRRQSQQENNPQPLTAVALVKFQPTNGQPFLRRYTNCRSNKTHAEEYFVNDVKANICSSFIGLKEVTMYITMQPCHKSTRPDTQGTKDDWSCCNILIDLAKNELKGVEIVIKPTHLSKAGWPRNKADTKYNKLIENAEKGIKKMMRSGIKLSQMEDSDWDDLWELFQPSTLVSKNNKERSSLDGYIGSKLKEWSTIASEKWSEESIRSNDRHLNISVDGKTSKVKWTGNFELLEEFVEKDLKELGEWTLTRDHHRFVSSDLCITWYSTTKTLQLQGNDGDRLKETLIHIYNQPADN